MKSMPMNSNKNFLFIVLATLLILAVYGGRLNSQAQPNPATPSKGNGAADSQSATSGGSPDSPATRKLREDLVGTWELVGTQNWGATNFTPASERYEGMQVLKIFTRTHSIVFGYDKADGKMSYSSGGPYTLKDNVYTEHITFGSGGNARFIGAHPHFHLRIEGNKLYQKGVNGHPPIDEIYQRVKDETK